MSFYTLTKSLKLLNLTNTLIKRNNKPAQICNCFLQTNLSWYSTETTEQEKKKRPKTVPIPRITLISGEEVKITTLEEAQRISKRRDLKLVKIIDLDAKTQRPVYKLMTGSEYHAEDLKQRENKKKERENASIKGEKVLILSSSIQQHDIDVNVKKISKWLKKCYEVKVVINGDAGNMEKAVSFQ